MSIKSLLLIISLCFAFLAVKSQSDIEYYNQGEVLRYAGQYEKAEQEYLKAINLNPNMFDAHIELAIIEYEVNQNYENATNYLDYCIQNTKDTKTLMRVYLEKGIIYSVLNEDKKSLKMFNKGIALKGDGEPKALLYAARGYEIHFFNKNINKALTDFEKSVQIQPTYEVYKARGELFYSIENYEDAEINFTNALRIDDSKNPLILYYIGKTRYWLDKNELALKDFKAISLEELSVIPEYIPDYYYYKGSVEYYLKRWNEAIVSLKESISITDTVADVHYRLGRSYLKLKRYQDAISSYNESLKYEENDVFALKDIGISYLKLEEYKSAENYLEKAKFFDGKNFAVYQALGQLKTGQKKYDEAIVNYNIGLDLVKGKELTPDGELEYYRAITYFKLSEKEKGCADLEKALEFGFDKEKINQLKEKYCKE